jgi:hypothetical protein
MNKWGVKKRNDKDGRKLFLCAKAYLLHSHRTHEISFAEFAISRRIF